MAGDFPGKRKSGPRSWRGMESNLNNPSHSQNTCDPMRTARLHSRRHYLMWIIPWYVLESHSKFHLLYSTKKVATSAREGFVLQAVTHPVVMRCHASRLCAQSRV